MTSTANQTSGNFDNNVNIQVQNISILITVDDETHSFRIWYMKQLSHCKFSIINYEMEDIYKLHLLSTDKELQFEAITEISAKLLNIEEKTQLHAYIKTLIDKGIAWILCHFMKVSNRHILRSTLLIFQIIADCPAFYTMNIARRATFHILQKGNQFTDRDDNEHKILLSIANTLSLFLNNAVRFKIPINSFSNIDKLLKFINELDVNKISNSSYTIAVANFYASAISHADTIQYKNTLNIIIKVHEDVLKAANKAVIDYVEDGDPMIEDIMRPIIVICNEGIKFCEKNDKHIASTAMAALWTILNEHGNYFLQPILDITCETLLETVIPNATYIDVITELQCVSSVNFLDSLCQLYQRTDIDLDKFSWQLSKYGYIKYLYGMLDESKPYHDNLCEILTYIAELISQRYLAMDKWSDGLEGFRTFIKNQLLTMNEYALSDNGVPLQDAVLYLIYIHFHSTTEFNIFDFITAVIKLNMSKKIMSLSVDNIPEIPTLQVILSLFSMSALAKSSGEIDQFFHIALQRITQIVKKAGLENCYTHNREFPILMAEGVSIPDGMPHNTLELWLQYEDNVYLLLTPGPSNTLIDCLLNILTRIPDGIILRCPWRFSRTLNDCVNFTLSLSEQITQSMWANFPRVLANYTKESESNIELYLKMLNPMVITTLLKNSTVIECTDAIITLLQQGNLELSMDMKALLTQQAAKMLNIALLAANGSVVQLFVNHYSILEILCNEAFNKDYNIELSTLSLECLVGILRSQMEFSIQCYTPVVLSQTKLFCPLMPRESSYYDALNFFDRMWSCDVERPAIIIERRSKNETKETLIGIYRMYCVIHMNNHRESQLDLTFYCLANFLRFLRFCNRPALIDCCEYICNSDITISAIKSNNYSYRFIDFVSTWAKLSVKRPTPSVIAALQSIQDRREVKKRIFHESPFLKALYNMDEYVKKAIQLGNLREAEVVELMTYLKQLL